MVTGTPEVVMFDELVTAPVLIVVVKVVILVVTTVGFVVCEVVSGVGDEKTVVDEITVEDELAGPESESFL